MTVNTNNPQKRELSCNAVTVGGCVQSSRACWGGEILTAALRSKHHACPYFTDEETEAHRRPGVFLEARKNLYWNLHSDLPDFQVHILTFIPGCFSVGK